jgi:hypothetical protein
MENLFVKTLYELFSDFLLTINGKHFPFLTVNARVHLHKLKTV